MKALLIKEIRSYLSSIIGYAAIIVFLIATGFFVWVFPGNNNIIEMGEASLQPFFSQAPGILIFLLPAFTMRCFAEENKSGTIELLATKPISLTKIVLSKYLASCIIGIFAILIRVFNPAYPEGMMLAILLMNVFAPLVDHYVIEANIKRRLKRSKA